MLCCYIADLLWGTEKIACACPTCHSCGRVAIKSELEGMHKLKLSFFERFAHSFGVLIRPDTTAYQRSNGLAEMTGLPERDFRTDPAEFTVQHSLV